MKPTRLLALCFALLLCFACGDDGGEASNNDDQPEETQQDIYMSQCTEALTQCQQHEDGAPDSACELYWNWRNNEAKELDGCLQAEIERWDCWTTNDCGEDDACRPESEAVGTYC